MAQASQAASVTIPAKPAAPSKRFPICSVLHVLMSCVKCHRLRARAQTQQPRLLNVNGAQCHASCSDGSLCHLPCVSLQCQVPLKSLPRTYRFPPCTAHRLRAPAVETSSQTFCCYGYASMEAAEGRHQVPTKARAVPVAAVSKCTFRACVAFGLQRGFESRSAVLRPQCLKLMNLRRSYVPYKFFRPKC